MNPDPTSLDRLHDVVVPPPLPWWPPAPGWYGLLGVTALFAVALTFWSLMRWQRNRYRREALIELARCEATLATPVERGRALATIAELLKRAALSAWPRADVAALNGPAWLAFLDRTSNADRFSSPIGALLETAAYDARKALDLDAATLRELITLARHWVTHHRVDLIRTTEREC